MLGGIRINGNAHHDEDGDGSGWRVSLADQDHVRVCSCKKYRCTHLDLKRFGARITELYLFVNEPIIGISSCAPIRRKSETSSEIYAVTCVDVRATGDLNDFFDLGSSSELNPNFYLMFNEDEAFAKFEW